MTGFRWLLTLLPIFALVPVPGVAEPVALVEAARAQIGVTTRYDGAYRKLEYPGGDVPEELGVCTDVVIRAYRALGADLQVLVHEDMKSHFGEYPKNWGLKRTDRNIDHRRVPNLRTFFKRHGTSLSPSKKANDYLPGDLVTWRLSSGLPHIGVVSDASKEGRPLIVHNIGAGVVEDDVLFAFTVTGHYRFSVPASTSIQAEVLEVKGHVLDAPGEPKPGP